MFNEFKNKYLGKKVDIDGLYGGQCVDLFNAWNKDYNNGIYISCRPDKYAKGLAIYKNSNGLLKYFKETQVNNMIEGTVVVYGKCKFAPSSHVCFFIKDNGNGTFQALQQNYNNKQYVTIDNNPYEGIIGAFIPNQLVNSNNDNQANTGADQILYKGSKVMFYGCQIKDIRTKGNVTSFYSDVYGCWLPITPFYRVDGAGNYYANQKSSKGNWLKSDIIYNVIDIDVSNNKALINVEGTNYWVKSSGLYEVSNG